MQSIFGKSTKIDYKYLYKECKNSTKKEIDEIINRLQDIDIKIDNSLNKPDELYYEKALIFYNLSCYFDAEKNISMAIVNNNKIAKYHFLHGLLYEDLYKESFECFNHASKIEPNNLKYIIYKLEANAKLGNINDSLEECNDIIEQNILEKELLGKCNYIIGYCYLKNKQYKEAVKCLEKSININKTHDESYYYLGLSYFKLKKYDKMQDNFKLVLKLNSKKYYSYENIPFYKQFFSLLFSNDIKIKEFKKLYGYFCFINKYLFLVNKRDISLKIISRSQNCI